MCRQSATTVCLTKSPTAEQRAASGIADWLAVLRDPRDRRGRRHSLVAVLLTACCAVLAGARSYLAIGRWARRAPQDTLARLGVRGAGLGVRRAPSGATIRRILTLVCPGGLADLLGCDPAGAGHLAVDGKAARGSRTDTAPAAHLLSAVLADGRTVSQLRVTGQDHRGYRLHPPAGAVQSGRCRGDSARACVGTGGHGRVGRAVDRDAG